MQNLNDVCRRRGIASPDERNGLKRAAWLPALPLLASLALAAHAAVTHEQDQPAPNPADSQANRQANSQASSDIEAYARLPVCTLSPDGQHLALQPCRTAPARVPMPRRPVPQQIDPLPDTRLAPPVSPPPSSMVMPPALIPRPAATVAPLTAPLPAAGALAPMPRALNNCSAAGCNDAQGGRINNTAPGMVITPQGQVCSRNGVWIQC